MRRLAPFWFLICLATGLRAAEQFPPPPARYFNDYAHVVPGDVALKLNQKLEEATGQTPPWSANAFPDVDEDARESIRRIKDSPFIPNKASIRGFVYDVETGKLREVQAGGRFERETESAERAT